jgi:hypothetical protein
MKIGLTRSRATRGGHTRRLRVTRPIRVTRMGNAGERRLQRGGRVL